MAEEQRTGAVEGEGYAVANISDLGEGWGFRKIRKGLGVTAFGVNAIVMPPSYETGRHYHDEQEELYFLHRGRVEIEFGDGTSHVLEPGGLARVDASTVRRPPQPQRQRGRGLRLRRRQGRLRRPRRPDARGRDPPAHGPPAPPSSEVLVDPGHRAAEVLADPLDRVLGTLLPHPREVLAAGAVLGDPLAGELARLDFPEHLLHRRP